MIPALYVTSEVLDSCHCYFFKTLDYLLNSALKVRFWKFLQLFSYCHSVWRKVTVISAAALLVLLLASEQDWREKQTENSWESPAGEWWCSPEVTELGSRSQQNKKAWLRQEKKKHQPCKSGQICRGKKTHWGPGVNRDSEKSSYHWVGNPIKCTWQKEFI